MMCECWFLGVKAFHTKDNNYNNKAVTLKIFKDLTKWQIPPYNYNDKGTKEW